MTNPSHLKVRYLFELPELPPGEVENSWTYTYVPNGPDKDYKVFLPTLISEAVDYVSADILQTAADYTDQETDQIRQDLLATADGLGTDMVTYKLDDTNSVARGLRDKLGDTISVKDFGAVGDGVADDAPAINAALAYAHARGGGTVWVPRGSYLLKQILSIGSNTSLIAEDGVVYLKDHTATFLNNGLGFTTSSSIPPYGGHHDIVIEGGTWEGFPFGVIDEYTGFALGYGRNITLRKVILKDSMSTGHAIDMTCCDNVLIEDCQFLGQRLGDGSPLFSEMIQLDGSVEGSFPYFGLPTFRQNKNITIRRCIFGPNPDNTDPEFGPPVVAIGGHSCVYDQWAENITIENCEFNEVEEAAIRIFKWKGVKIIGNTFRSCNQPIFMSGGNGTNSNAWDIDRVDSGKGQGCRDILIQGNVIEDFIGTALFLRDFPAGTETDPYHFDVRILDNVLTAGASSGSCLQLRACSNVRISGNKFSGGSHGVYSNTAPSHFVKINNNDFDGQTGHSVWLNVAGSNFIIDANSFENGGDRGVHCTAVDGFICTNNQFYGMQNQGIHVTSAGLRGKIAGNQLLLTNIGVSSAAIQVQAGTGQFHVTDNHVPASNTYPTAPLHVVGGSGGNFASCHVVGTPEGVVTAPVGSVAYRTDGGAGTTLYIKETGTGNTGWVAK